MHLCISQNIDIVPVQKQSNLEVGGWPAILHNEIHLLVII